ncbi:MAG: septal ring lytic transglycosylase RlpA family protein [Candidatus Omnitrophota bacterium]
MGRLINYGCLTGILVKLLLVVCFALALRVCSDISAEPIAPGVSNVKFPPSVSAFSSVPIYGIASWYSEKSPGINGHTANGEEFDHDKITCASWDFPFGTLLEVTNIDNGKKIIVKVNDRGPAKRLYRTGRVIDLTKAAFAKIEDFEKGLAHVKVRVIR